MAFDRASLVQGEGSGCRGLSRGAVHNAPNSWFRVYHRLLHYVHQCKIAHSYSCAHLKGPNESPNLEFRNQDSDSLLDT